MLFHPVKVSLKVSIFCYRYKNATALAQKCPKIDSKHEKTRGVRQSGPRRQTVTTEKKKLRKGLILEFVNDCIVVDDPVKIYRHVLQSNVETEKRVEFGTMDRKYFRLVFFLFTYSIYNNCIIFHKLNH